MRQKKHIRVYAAGGAGSNIASGLESYRDQDQAGFGILDVCYVDTSASNINSLIPEEACYLINVDGVDGSGKFRATNYKVIESHIPSVMQQFPPLDFNITISSAGGGSGSVISPFIISKLMAEGKPVLAIVIGSPKTDELQNTINTLKSYEGVSEENGVPLAMAYFQNTNSLSQGEVDNDIAELVVGLCALWAGQHDNLDTEDLLNFLRYDKLTSFPVGVVGMEFLPKGREVSKYAAGNLVTVATLATRGMATEFPVGDDILEYQTIGYVDPAVDPALISMLPLHFALYDDTIGQALAQLTAAAKTITAVKKARIPKPKLITEGDKRTGSGIIL